MEPLAQKVIARVVGRENSRTPENVEMIPHVSKRNQEPPSLGAVRVKGLIGPPVKSDMTQFINILKERRVPAEGIASSVVGKIRYMYIESLLTEDKFDIETLKYLDSILFNNMIYLISSVIVYGGNPIITKHIKESIVEVCSIIDYDLSQEGLEQIYAVVDEICNG